LADTTGQNVTGSSLTDTRLEMLKQYLEHSLLSKRNITSLSLSKHNHVATGTQQVKFQYKDSYVTAS
jgi:hypothetical protein